MLSTGIRAQLGIKVFGDSLEELQRKAFDVERVVRSIPGAVGVAASRVQGKPYVEIEVDRTQAARFGLNARDVLDVVESGIGGSVVGTAIEGRARLPIQVRLEASQRDDIDQRQVHPSAPEEQPRPGGVHDKRRSIDPKRGKGS